MRKSEICNYKMGLLMISNEVDRQLQSYAHHAVGLDTVKLG